MLAIQFPDPDFQIRKEQGKNLIFDSIRKKWLLLTPEEWVRQNFIQYLLKVMHYPSTLLAQEKMIRVGELQKRFDILMYDRQHKPWMMIECKAPAVALDESVLQQLLRYHVAIPAGYLVITNGERSIGWQKIDGQLQLLNELPIFELSE